MVETSSDPYLQRFLSHPLHSVLREARTVAQRLATDDTKRSPDASLRLHRLGRGLEKAQRQLESVDGSLVGSTSIKESHRALNELQQQLAQFEANHQEPFLNAANDQLDNGLLVAVNKMPRVESPQDVTPILSFLDTERARIGAAIRDVEEYGATVRSTVDAMLANNQRINTAVEKQDDRLQDLVQRIDAVVSDFNARAADAERGRDQQFAASMIALRNEVESYLKENRDTLSQQGAELARKSEEIIKQLSGYRSQAASLLQIIGDIGVTSPFDKTATQDRRAAFWLRVVAGLFFLGMVATVVATAWQLAKEGLAWEYMAFRFMTALIFAVPAYYFARESSKFQSEADRNRRLQLELASIGPFIENLESARKDGLREELTKRYFGAAMSAHQMERPIDLRELLEIVKEFARSGKR